MSDEQEYNSETFKEIYELTKGRLDRQIDEGQMLDSKLVQVFGAASVVIGLVGFSATGGAITDLAAGVLLVFALLAYSAVAYITFHNYSPRVYEALNYPDVWRQSWSDSPDDLHHSVIVKVVRNYEENQTVLEGKASAIRLAIVATGIEVLLVGISLIVAIFEV